MKKNLGPIDRYIRIILAIAIGVLYYTGVLKGTIGIVFLVIGALLIITGIFGTCALYRLFGINSDRQNTSNPTI